MAKILYVEDYPAAALTMEYVLSELGHECVTAETGQAALEAYARQPFDMVLIDTQLPDMDGPDVSKNLRQWEKDNRRKPSVFIGFSADTKGSEASHISGMDGFALKSLSLTDVKRLLEEYL